MAGRIWNVQVHHPGPAPGESGEDYWSRGLGSRLAGLYGELLGARLIDIGYKKLARDGDPVEIGFERAPDNPPPSWPDPERPHQAHLDIEVGDVDGAEEVARRWGANRLLDAGDHRVLADPFGHPFCVWQRGGAGSGPARIARVVFDCFSPRALAVFYEQLLGFTRRLHDSPARVVLASGDPLQPMLAFQHAEFAAARWPDPAYPAQLHLDLGVPDLDEGRARAEKLGAIRLPHPRGAVVYADPAAHPFCLGDLAEPDPAVVEVHRQWRDARLGPTTPARPVERSSRPPSG